MAFAVLASLLVVTAMPVTASHGQLAVGSSHSDNTELGSGTLTNTTVQGTGESASVSLLHWPDTDGFEDGDLAEYSAPLGSKSNFTVQKTTVDNGTYALNGGESDEDTIISTSLPNLPRRGDVISYRTYFGAEDNSYFHFAAQSETNRDSYRLDIRDAADELRLYKFENGSATLINSTNITDPPNNEWLKVHIDFGDTNTSEIVATTYDSTGTELATITAQDTTYDSGGIGFSQDSSSIYFDSVKVNNASSTGQYISQNHSVSSPIKGWTDLSLTNASATVEWQAWNSSSTQWQVVNSSEFSSTGNYTLDISGTSFETWRVNVTFNKTDSNPSAKLHDEGILVETHEPVVDDSSLTPNSTSSTQNRPVTLSANISDNDFETSYGDNATVYWFVDGEKRGTTTASANGTTSFTLDNVTAGEHDWHVEVADEYDHRTVSATAQFAAPSKLYIYHETQPEKLVKGDNLSLTVRFYPLEAGSSTDVVTRNVTDGVANLSGLPADQRFVVTVKAQDTSNYTYRRIVVDSLFDSNRIYLLNESEPHSQVVFELEDPTGQFPPEQTILYVEKPIEVNNSTTYQTIAGDTFGSTASFPAVLQRDERYRLRVETADGSSQRILGAYTVYGATVEPLQIQRIEPNSNVDAGSTVYGSLGTYNGTPSVAVRFRDLANNSTEVTYQVRQGDTVIVENTTSSADSFAHIHQVTNASGEYTVEYWIEHPDGVTTHDSFTVGEVPEVASRFNINPQVLSITSWIMILATMGLLAIVDAKLAPMGGTGMASGLVILGTVAIPSSILGVAGAISVLTLFGGDQ